MMVFLEQYDLESQSNQRSQEELKELVRFDDYKNVSLGVQLIPPTLQMIFNETQYEIDCDNILKTSSFVQYKFKSIGTY
jgi:hypothetical protein